jgi:hypothetical protein
MDPDPYQNVMDPQHCTVQFNMIQQSHPTPPTKKELISQKMLEILLQTAY